MEEIPTTTPILGDTIITKVIIFVSDVVFRWVPATISVITGVDVSPFGLEEPLPQPETPPQPPEDITIPAPESFFEAWSVFSSISVFLSLILVAIIVYIMIRLLQIRRRESAMQQEAIHPVASGAQTKMQVRWARILEQANSENPNDWRLAILEADILLDDLLEAQGYHGDTMGDKMKQVERSDFNTIDLAWEAHKVRNRIAHEGEAHELNPREVRRITGLYEQVFREFHFV